MFMASQRLLEERKLFRKNRCVVEKKDKSTRDMRTSQRGPNQHAALCRSLVCSPGRPSSVTAPLLQAVRLCGETIDPRGREH